MKSILTVPRLTFTAAVAAVVALACLWFATFHRVIVMGDDALLVYQVLHGGFRIDPQHAFTTVLADKYRPVLQLVLGVIVPIFGANFVYYESLNLLVELANAAVVARTVWIISRRSALLAFGAAVAFVICRFGYYNVLQIFGLMEGLALLFMLLSVMDCVRAYANDRLAPLIRAVVWYGLAVFTHERYLVLGLFIVLCIVFHPQARTERLKAALIGIGTCGILLLNVALKIVVFHSTVLMGTAGEKMSAASPIGHFLLTGLENVLGFNVGPAYLAAQDLSSVGPLGYVVGILVVVPAIVIFGAYLAQGVRTRSLSTGRTILISLVLFGSLLLTASITIRQEFRWLYGPEAIFFIGLAGAAAYSNLRRVGTLLVAIAFASSIAGALLYRPYVENIFFVYSMGIASDVRSAMLAAPTRKIAIAEHGDTTLPNWVFMQGEFYSLYGLSASNVRYVVEPSEVRDRTTEILSVSGSHADAVSVPDPVVAAPAIANVPAIRSSPRVEPAHVRPFAHVVTSLETAFPNGKINRRDHADTPSGTGAFLFSWRDGTRNVQALTVLATFRYAYTIVVEKGEGLGFYVARPYAIGSPTRASVTVTAGTKTTPVYDAILAPAASLKWERQLIDLSKFAGQSVEITFSADSPNGDQSAAWIAFADPSIVRLHEKGEHKKRLRIDRTRRV